MTAAVIVTVLGFGVLVGNIAVMVKMLLTLDDIRDEARRVALNLARAQQAVDGVADNLAAAHDRADATKGSPGEAGDAAAKSG